MALSDDLTCPILMLLRRAALDSRFRGNDGLFLPNRPEEKRNSLQEDGQTMTAYRTKAFALLLKAKDSTLLRFLVVGGVNTVFGYTCYAAALGLLGFPLPVALFISQILGVAFNFHSYGSLVFQCKGGAKEKRVMNWPIVTRFCGVYAATYALNLGLLKMLSTFQLSPYLTQILALFIIVPTTYLLLRHFVWKRAR